MKTIFNKITFLVLLVVFFGSCNDKDDSLSICKTEDLGITQLSKYTYVTYQTINGNQVIDDANSYKWEWKTYNDTIEITGWCAPGDGYTAIHEFFKKDKGCMKYLSSRWVYHSDTGSNLDNWGLSFKDTIYPSFRIQEYIEDEKFIAEVAGNQFDIFVFWMEFNPENHHPAPYDYEQFYPAP